MECSWPRCSCKATGVQLCKTKKGTKKAPTPLKRTPIKKVSDKGKIKKLDKKALIQTDMLFYLTEIWEKQTPICFETGMIITEPKTFNFHHLLEKAKYPQYRHKRWNIVLVTWETHDQVHKNIDKTPLIKKRTEKLLKLHKDYDLLSLCDNDIESELNS
jgi:hypothetical protein